MLYSCNDNVLQDMWWMRTSEARRARIDKAPVKKDEFDSRFIAKDILSFTLTEKGSFVREIFFDETAKGLDALGLATLNIVASASSSYLPVPVPHPSSLMTEEDIVNLRNLRRLVHLVSGLEDSGTGIIENINNYENRRSYASEISQLLDQITSSQEIFPFLTAVNELPIEQQQRLLSLPADVLARLVPRMAARTV